MFSSFYDDIYNYVTDYQRDVLKYLSYSVSGLSLLGSILIVLIYLLNKDLRSFSYLLIVNLTISVALQDISKLLSIGINYVDGPSKDVLCMMESYFLNYSQLAALFWSSIISWSLYSTVILLRKKITTDQDRFYLAGFGTPVAISLIPLISNDYGSYEIGCWITTRSASLIRGTIIRNICYYIPLLLGIIINFYLITKVRFYVNTALPNDPSTIFLNRLYWYPYLLLLILVTYLVKVVALEITHSEIALFITLIFTTFFANLLGVYIFFIFGYTKSVKEIIVSKFQQFFGVQPKRESENIDDSEKIGGNSNLNSHSNSNASEKAAFPEEEEEKDYYYNMH